MKTQMPVSKARWPRAPAWVLISALAVFLPSARAEAVDPIDARLDSCLQTDKGQTTAGMVACTGEGIRAWDQRLNQTYQQVMTALDPKSRELLRASQRQWVAFRNAEKAAQAAPWTADRGTQIRVQLMGVNLAAIKARVEELQLYQP